MKSIHPSLIALLMLGCTITLDSQAAGAATSVPSERNRAMAKALPVHWRSEMFPANQVSRLHYPEISADRILEVQQYNATRRMKPAQSGIARSASKEGAASTLPPLRWIKLANGGSVSRIEVASPVAMGLRVGVKVQALDARAELRFAGSSRPSRVVAMMTGMDILGLTDSRGIFWTPDTDGEKQFIEIYLPAGVSPAAVRLQAPLLSHLLVNGLDDARVIEKSGFGQSGACNVNTVCRVAELGAHYVSAKNAVAHMSYTYPNGSSFICSGTLLADTVAGTQIPYFYTAHHCFAGGVSGVPATSYPSGFQTVANTLITYWKYETTACASSINPQSTLLAGGSDYLYSDPNTDAMLLRLRSTPPAGSEFSGWDYALLPASSNIVGIHHPSGDAKKVSSGQQLSRDADQNEVAWLSGTTEGGSSGSGLFTVDATGYHLRGGLLGGNASCANTGSLSNTGNRDYYSRFDVVFPNISQYLAPTPATPQRMNGSQPLIPPRPSPVTQAAPTPSPRKIEPRRIPMGPFEP
jgi:hypothetical protein